MPTFVFRNVITHNTKHAQAPSLNRARDKIPEAYDGTLWLPWECWERGQCVWHYDLTGECKNGPRP